MNATLAPLDMHAVFRMLYVFAHMICLAAAGGFIVLGDYAIFGQKRQVNAELLGKAANFTLLALLGLWITGACIIWMDTHFDLNVLMTKPKLLAKLTVAIALSANGVLLHFVAFPRLASPKVNSPSSATIPAILGAVSLTSWMYAAFIGEAKPLASFLGYQGFVELYGALLLAAITIALIFIRPRLAYQMTMSKGKAVGSSTAKSNKLDKGRVADWMFEDNSRA